jgi:DNA-binding MarR family transcriptional regulator
MPKGKTRSPDDALAGSVTHLLHRALQLALDFHTEATGPAAITQRQFTVLTAAGSAEGLTQNDLVRATGIDRSTLADLVARMLSKGLLVRERSPTDARANSVRLSEAGRLALEAGAGPAADADAKLLSFLSPKKRENFIKTLSTLAAAADDPSLLEKKAAKTKPGKSKSGAAKASGESKAKSDKPAKARKKDEAGDSSDGLKGKKKQKKAKIDAEPGLST